jgi:hypothetical protein
MTSITFPASNNFTIQERCAIMAHMIENINEGELIMWEGATLQECKDLIAMAKIDENYNQQGDFHAWCEHKKTGEIYDDYNNPDTKCGYVIQEIMKLHKCDEIVYEEFEKTPKFLERLVSTQNSRWNEFPFFKKFKSAQNYNKPGFCFSRAFLKNKKQKKMKMKFGETFIANKKTGKKFCIEGKSKIDGNQNFMESTINLCKLQYFTDKMNINKVKTIINFWCPTNLQPKMAEIIDSWETTKNSSKSRVRKNRKQVKCLKKSRGGGFR